MKIGDIVKIIDPGVKTTTYPAGVQDYQMNKRGQIVEKFNGCKASPGYHLVVYQLMKAGVMKDYCTNKREDQLVLIKG